MVSFRMCDETIISEIVGIEYMQSWLDLSPTVYLKDGKPYGLIGYAEADGIKYVAATVPNPNDKFTISMIKDIMNLHSSGNICLVTDSTDHQEYMANILSRYNFRFEYKYGMMYSYNFGKDI